MASVTLLAAEEQEDEQNYMALNGMNQFTKECSPNSNLQPKHLVLPHVRACDFNTIDHIHTDRP